MLPLFHEYHVHHPRFREHARIAYLMALVAPCCAIFFFRAIGWWNPWLWSSCGVGLALALGLHAVIALHRRPAGISAYSRGLVDRSDTWFPYFFVVMQSSIASLIVMFLWFSITALVLEVPLYAHLILVALALLLPARRYYAARYVPGGIDPYERRREVLRAVWHVLLTIFITRSIIGLTITDLRDTSPENIAWQIICWVPASLYMLFVIVLMIDHLRRTRPRSGITAPPERLDNAAVDRL